MISVCMTTYNGEKYLKAQLSSILSQLSYDDECLISDDGSTDHTIAIIQEFQNKYPQIRLLQGPRKGVIANFNYCISQSKGDFIFLADQDDVWHADKVEKILALFQLQPQTKLILSDLAIVDSDLKLMHASYFKYKKVKTGTIANIIRNRYIGAGMAFRADLKHEILPIPNHVPMHDMFIGIMAEPNVALLPEVLTDYRRHEDNASQLQTKSSKLQQLIWRVNLIWAIIYKKFIRK